MNIFERYILVQQMKPFIFFSFVLVGILWLIKALPRLDDVISNGQSGLVFLDIALLILPQVEMGLGSVREKGNLRRVSLNRFCVFLYSLFEFL